MRGELRLKYIRLLSCHLFETRDTRFLLFHSWFDPFGGLSLRERIALKRDRILYKTGFCGRGT